MKAAARIGLVLIWLLFATEFVSANPPQLYVAGAVQANGTFQTIHKSNGKKCLELDGGTGLQFEVGAERGRWLGYLGFRHDGFDYEVNGEVNATRQQNATTWRANYLLIGGRWFTTKNEAASPRPFLGLGLSAGWAARKSDQESQSAGPKLGALAELGLKIPIAERVNLWAVGRWDRLAFNFPATASLNKTSYTLQPTLHAGLSCSFPFNRF
jgi:hypothetical protein